MHGSVLQNKKYMEFAADNTVEVLALQRLDEGMQKGDPKAAEYDAVDEDGKPVKYMLSWPNLTKDEILALNSSKAGTYNDSKGIPFTAVVNPHTEERMQAWSGGQSAKTIMERVEELKQQLNAKYGPSLKRSDVAKFNASAKDVRAKLAADGVAKSLPDAQKLVKSWTGKGAAIEADAKALEAEVLAKAADELDAVEANISAGDLAAAKKALGPLVRVLKGTAHEARANELLGKTKTEE